MSNLPPEVIFLQFYGDVPADKDLTQLDPDYGDVSWSADKIYDADIAYVRATAATDPRLTEVVRDFLKLMDETSDFPMLNHEMMVLADLAAKARSLMGKAGAV